MSRVQGHVNQGMCNASRDQFSSKLLLSTSRACSRLIALYGVFALAVFMCVLLLLAQLLAWPAGVKPLAAILLLLLSLVFVLVVALTAVLKVGNDG